MPKFRAKIAVQKLREASTETHTKVECLTSLLAFVYLDQKDRPRRRPTRARARRVVSTQFAKRVRLITNAHLHDRTRLRDPKSALRRRLLSRVRKCGGLSCIADGPAIDEMIAAFKANHKEVQYVVQVVDYIVRSHAYREDGFPLTIEDAKAFTHKWVGEFGIAKISQLWEAYKLVAPYLWALSLERSFKPSETSDIDDAIDWSESFVKCARRVARFLGHASFAMDVLKRIARDQRERDFDDVPRIVPRLPRFNDEEKLIFGSIDRNGAIA
jgi:hypothetical protein